MEIERRAEERDGEIGILPAVEVWAIGAEDGAPCVATGGFDDGWIIEGNGERILGIEEADEVENVRRVDCRFCVKTNSPIVDFDG